MTIIQQMVTRIRAEYLDMPGLHLTAPQVQRLCGIELQICQAALDSLVGAQFLQLSADGRYTRLTNREIARHRIAKAELHMRRNSSKASHM